MKLITVLVGLSSLLAGFPAAARTQIKFVLMDESDYAWSKNEHYIDNQSRVSVVAQEQGRLKVARIVSTTDAGAKLETEPIPFAEGYRYAAQLAFKGRDYRIYFTGYKWKPGVKPHDHPRLSELRQVYKSRMCAMRTMGSPGRPYWSRVGSLA